MLGGGEEVAGVVDHHLVYGVLGDAEVSEEGDDVAVDEEVTVGVAGFTPGDFFLAGAGDWDGPVVAEHYLVAVPGLDEPDGCAGAVLPVGGVGAFGGEAGIAVEADPSAFFEKLDKVGDVGSVIAVADVDAVEVDTLLFEDAGLLEADPLGGPGVS